MKATGMVRQIDDLGRVVIPKELRRTLGISERDPLEIFIDGNRVILQKYAPGCVLCGAVENVEPGPYGKLICKGCTDQIKGQAPKLVPASMLNE
ncbi:AbrB family transcriptional regulator [Paenibacillus selenitireducens]|uniref:AbrB family transcriptional regulator n=1 Tax=Paenibacillus selenitireducens TaxID=1324314 RepID=A0A1T2XAA3_9BACL|nr:AbrB/MazE/SpoVT family DNA-binding domain-containing protein [Paenibacillus selenitireducens]OPA76770.1 AbrB family transcriptional regulator [Paenibacillus selenitireducens]